MRSYTYQGLYIKSSTVRINITDSEGVAYGSVERYFKNIFHKIFDMWIGENKLISNHRAFNKDGEKIIEAHKNNYKVKRSDYQIAFLSGKHEGVNLVARQKRNRYY